YAGPTKTAYEQAQAARDAARRAVPPVPVVMAVEDNPAAENVRVHLRGSTLNLGDEVPRGFPAVLVDATGPTAASAPPRGLPPDVKGSGRGEFARWLTDPRHPLTARVAVNRVWQHLF